jgi:DNA-binding NtrC family response regulator
MDSSLKIFIVEDDLFYQTMLFGVLKLRNFKHVKKMATGKECLENLYLKPDVIILDYSLSDMNGVELFKQIKKIDPNIKVIFLSGQQNGMVVIKTLRLGAIEYFEKSSENIMSLIKLVQRISIDKKYKITGFFKVHHKPEQERLILKYISLVNL